MRVSLFLLTSLMPALAAAALTPDTVAVQGEPPSASGPAVGIEGSTSSPVASSAGVVGQALGTAGPTWGVRGVADSPDGVAGLFEANGGGDPLVAVSSAGGVFVVDSTGALVANSFAGDGSSLVGGPSLICTGCVGSGDLAPASVTAVHLQAGAVSSSAIQDGAVSDLKIANGAIGKSELADGSVGSSEIADRTLTAAHVVTWAVSTDKLATNTVTGDKVAFAAVSLRRIAQYDLSLEIFEVHDDCEDSREPTRETGCTSRLCGAGPIRFFDCEGNCTSSTPRTCFNEYIGLALHDSE